MKKYLDLDYIMMQAGIKVLFLYWGIMMGVSSIAIYFILPSMVSIPDSATTAQRALIQEFISFPECLIIYSLTIPVMVMITLLTRKKWFPWE